MTYATISYYIAMILFHFRAIREADLWLHNAGNAVTFKNIE